MSLPGVLSMRYSGVDRSKAGQDRGFSKGTLQLTDNLFEILVHLLAAMLAGGLIGLERSYNGHAAGFRTHTLVCMASSLLMLIAIYQKDWFSLSLIENVRIDPTRMAQGIMTGIGFLGAGVIMKEGLSVRGLTTAASIWITAAIGILAGVGFYSALIIVTVLTLGTLSVFRWIESKLPTLIYAQCSLRLDREASMNEKDLRDLLARHGFDILKLSYAYTQQDGNCFTYSMMIRTRKRQHFEKLSQSLLDLESVHEFRISLTGD
jgi:putative Mg2+ transporter-C (MgtC) family protein